ncbi:molybdenum cofactor biosynthesis protein [Obba rivulosa]|uniref:GTP 3',8-cyclase n=1 Tax=Obba rivulosa TaxID=1052685 RepID=A0A8E2ARC8_9APHY|nr:molybdenum cofactor biosynthesis protein [Obba rivulosa]
MLSRKSIKVARCSAGSPNIQERIERIDSEQSVSPFLVDTFDRKHNYLRISLTERCNLRCFYCMPEEGVELSPRDHILTDDEIIRLATLFVKSGVTKIRLTGGEPTVRKGIVNIVARLNDLRLHGLQSIGMTSNGIALARRLPTLVENGLTHLNLSLDTLDPFKFEFMTRRTGHDAVLRSLDTALSLGLQSVKLNVVVIKGLNDAEVLDFLEMTRDRDLSVRFIEFMPFTGNKWDKAKMLPSSELLDRIKNKHAGLIKASDDLNDTARSYIIPGYRGSFGFISSMSDHFCGSCNRLRLTADGQIKVCLFDAKEISLRDQIRSGASDAELARTIGLAVRGKKAKHAGMEDIDVVSNRPMILIGALHHSIPVPISSLAPPFSPAALRQQSSRATTTDETSSAPRLTHIDDSGRAAMVDVSSKEASRRTAVAYGRIFIPRVAFELITTRTAPEPERPWASDHSEYDGSESRRKIESAKAKARSKGDVLTVAQLAAIMGCKRTSDLIPLCHPLQLSRIVVTLEPEVHIPPKAEKASDRIDLSEKPDIGSIESTHTRSQEHSKYSIVCRAEVTCEGKTGVEMEALTAVSVGLLTVWDMLKAVAGKEMIVGDIMVVRKEGGKGGDFVRANTPFEE